MVKVFQDMDESLKETFPVYKSQAYSEGNFSTRLGTAEWWSEDFFDGLSFLASAYVPGAVFGKLGSAISASTKLGNAVKAAALSRGINTATVGFSTLYNTISESGFEATEVYNSLMDKYKEAVAIGSMTEEQAKAKAGEAAQRAFFTNMTLLGVPNFVQSRLMHSTFPDLVKAVRTTVREGKPVKDALKEHINVLKEMGISFASEGAFEENFQTAIGAWEDKMAFSENHSDFLDGYAHNMLTNVHGFSKFLFSKLGFSEDTKAGTDEDEGAAAIFLGGLIGKMTAARSELAKRKNIQNLYGEESDIWNKFKTYSAITKNMYLNESKSFLKTEEDADGNLIPILDAKNNYVANPQKWMDNMLRTARDAKVFENATLAVMANNVDMFNFNKMMALSHAAWRLYNIPGITKEDIEDVIKYDIANREQEAQNPEGKTDVDPFALSENVEQLKEVLGILESTADKLSSMGDFDADKADFNNTLLQVAFYSELKTKALASTVKDSAEAIEAEQEFLNKIYSKKGREELYGIFKDEIRHSVNLEAIADSMKDIKELTDEQRLQLDANKFFLEENQEVHGYFTKDLFGEGTVMQPHSFTFKDYGLDNNQPKSIKEKILTEKARSALIRKDVEDDLDRTPGLPPNIIDKLEQAKIQDEKLLLDVGDRVTEATEEKRKKLTETRQELQDEIQAAQMQSMDAIEQEDVETYDKSIDLINSLQEDLAAVKQELAALDNDIYRLITLQNRSVEELKDIEDFDKNAKAGTLDDFLKEKFLYNKIAPHKTLIKIAFDKDGNVNEGFDDPSVVNLLVTARLYKTITEHRKDLDDKFRERMLKELDDIIEKLTKALEQFQKNQASILANQAESRRVITEALKTIFNNTAVQTILSEVVDMQAFVDLTKDDTDPKEALETLFTQFKQKATPDQKDRLNELLNNIRNESLNGLRAKIESSGFKFTSFYNWFWPSKTAKTSYFGENPGKYVDKLLRSALPKVFNQANPNKVIQRFFVTHDLVELTLKKQELGMDAKEAEIFEGIVDAHNFMRGVRHVDNILSSPVDFTGSDNSLISVLREELAEQLKLETPEEGEITSDENLMPIQPTPRSEIDDSPEAYQRIQELNARKQNVIDALIGSVNNKSTDVSSVLEELASKLSSVLTREDKDLIEVFRTRVDEMPTRVILDDTRTLNRIRKRTDSDKILGSASSSGNFIGINTEAIANLVYSPDLTDKQIREAFYREVYRVFMHELIHAVTVPVFVATRIMEDDPDAILELRGLLANSEGLSLSTPEGKAQLNASQLAFMEALSDRVDPNQINVMQDFITLFNYVKAIKPEFASLYASNNVKEFIAELVDPETKEFLSSIPLPEGMVLQTDIKAKPTVWDSLVMAFLKLIGVRVKSVQRGESVLDRMQALLIESVEAYSPEIVEPLKVFSKRFDFMKAAKKSAPKGIYPTNQQFQALTDAVLNWTRKFEESTSGRNITLVKGIYGSGKTRMVALAARNAIVRLGIAKDSEIMAIGHTQMSSKNINDALGINKTTDLNDYLSTNGNIKYLIVDEAIAFRDDDMRALINHSNKYKVKVLALGDPSQTKQSNVPLITSDVMYGVYDTQPLSAVLRAKTNVITSIANAFQYNTEKVESVAGLSSTSLDNFSKQTVGMLGGNRAELTKAISQDTGRTKLIIVNSEADKARYSGVQNALVLPYNKAQGLEFDEVLVDLNPDGVNQFGKPFSSDLEFNTDMATAISRAKEVVMLVAQTSFTPVSQVSQTVTETIDTMNEALRTNKANYEKQMEKYAMYSEKLTGKKLAAMDTTLPPKTKTVVSVDEGEEEEDEGAPFEAQTPETVGTSDSKPEKPTPTTPKPVTPKPTPKPKKPLQTVPEELDESTNRPVPITPAEDPEDELNDAQRGFLQYPVRQHLRTIDPTKGGFIAKVRHAAKDWYIVYGVGEDLSKFYPVAILGNEDIVNNPLLNGIIDPDKQKSFSSPQVVSLESMILEATKDSRGNKFTDFIVANVQFESIAPMEYEYQEGLESTSAQEAIFKLMDGLNNGELSIDDNKSDVKIMIPRDPTKSNPRPPGYMQGVDSGIPYAVVTGLTTKDGIPVEPQAIKLQAPRFNKDKSPFYKPLKSYFDNLTKLGNYLYNSVGERIKAVQPEYSFDQFMTDYLKGASFEMYGIDLSLTQLLEGVKQFYKTTADRNKDKKPSEVKKVINQNGLDEFLKPYPKEIKNAILNLFDLVYGFEYSQRLLTQEEYNELKMYAPAEFSEWKMIKSQGKTKKGRAYVYKDPVNKSKGVEVYKD